MNQYLFTFCIRLVWLLLPCVAFCSDELPKISRDLGEQVLMMPVGNGFLSSTELETTIYKPPGNGPFPLALISDGKEFGNPRFAPRAQYPVLSKELVRRGFLVAIPNRRGYSKSGGNYIFTTCDALSSAEQQSKDVLDSLDTLRKRPDVDPTNILLLGQSYGGFISLATASKGPAGVKGVINFAGGLMQSPEMNCPWQDKLVNAFKSMGKDIKVPTLWFYGTNDSFWGADLPRKMYDAYKDAGGNVKAIWFGVDSTGDAHTMVSRSANMPVWVSWVESFAAEIGIPSTIRYQIQPTPRPPNTDFAVFSNVNAVPYLDDRRKSGYKTYLQMKPPKAFAIAPTGNTGRSSGGDDPLGDALDACRSIAKIECRLYAVDDDVVWTP